MNTSNVYVFDLEIYQNYFLAVFQNYETQKFTVIENPNAIRSFISGNKMLVGFNNSKFDDILLKYILNISTNELDIYNFCNHIITQAVPSKQYWDVNKMPRLWDRSIDMYCIHHQGSLKSQAADAQCDRIQELPFQPDSIIEKRQHPILLEYCKDDVLHTSMLFDKYKDEIEMRYELEKIWKCDLLIKHNAAISEAIFKIELGEVEKIENTIHHIDRLLYHFNTGRFKDIFTDFKIKTLLKTWNELDFNDVYSLTDLNKNLIRTLKINNTEYQVGMGGIHSKDTKCILNNSKDLLIDLDVLSYYPNIQLEYKYAPERYKNKYLKTLNKLTTMRLKAKKNNERAKANGLKIVINSSFGKSGNEYSILFDPSVFLQTTLTGQLLLLFLIQELNKVKEFNIISVNTDGVLLKIPKDKYIVLKRIYRKWEKITGMKLEENRYKKYIRRDINNYILQDENNNIKSKGIFGKVKGISTIYKKALFDYFINEIPIEKTIEESNNIIEYLFWFKGNRDWSLFLNNKKQQNILRWYISRNHNTYICKIKENKIIKVANSKGAVIMNNLKDDVSDLNKMFYIREIKKIINTVDENDDTELFFEL